MYAWTDKPVCFCFSVWARVLQVVTIAGFDLWHSIRSTVTMRYFLYGFYHVPQCLSSVSFSTPLPCELISNLFSFALLISFLKTTSTTCHVHDRTPESLRRLAFHCYVPMTFCRVGQGSVLWRCPSLGERITEPTPA